MRGLLVRVGVDMTCGKWNAPVDTKSGEFIYVPIPESGDCLRKGLVPKYSMVERRLARMGMTLPPNLKGNRMHLDPDFSTLTYGDCGAKATRLRRLGLGDLLVFYSGMRPVRSKTDELVYAIIGLYRVSEIVPACEVPRRRWSESAHTRRVPPDSGEYVVRAIPGQSGRLVRCIPIGERRDGRYWLKRQLLARWGETSDRYIQRSGGLPRLGNPEKFYEWFKKQRPRLVHKNN